VTHPTPLRPLHGSALPAHPVRPKSMTSVPLSGEGRAALESMVLSVFTDMTNAGRTFQSALSAVYLTGLQHGSAISEEERQ
jgi:hypothetical protein